jgi:hypothetical protein
MRKTITLGLLFIFGAASNAATVDDDVLLKAINFALTGHDGITYSFVDRGACVVNWVRGSSETAVQAIQTYHLNSVDASRISIQRMKSTSQFGVESLIRVELHGESVIQENGFTPPETTKFDLNDVTLDLHTTEYDRLMRAWRYIYSHGCKSGRSSF